MKKKIGTILDEDILFAAKHMALLQRKTLSEFLEDAIRTYLEMQKENLNISDETKGVMRISPGSLRKVMEDESYFES
jgi:metal-responsive CopG/Arc/MetJ family transcriptional regulator